MVRESDVLISNFRPGTLEAWGLGFEVLEGENPGLVWGAGSSFGHLGPDADREGADLAGQAAGGLISTIGAEGEAPSPVGVTIADHIASQNLAAGVLAALVHRGRTGKGQRVEVSLLGGQIWAQAAEFSHFLMTGEVPGRANHAHPLLRGLYAIFETRDGWIGVIGVPPHARDAFFIALDQPELALDQRYLGLLTSRADMDELFECLGPSFRRQTTAQWCERFRAIGVRYAPVRNYREVADDAGACENGYYTKRPDREGAQAAVVGTPIQMSATPLIPQGVAPTLGEHTDEVLGRFGYSSEEVAALRARGIV
jgi:crotonobetainyl-CoA:carnitine CoA-transferase CaiB-like acyl-CoA transferase